MIFWFECHDNVNKISRESYSTGFPPYLSTSVYQWNCFIFSFSFWRKFHRTCQHQHHGMWKLETFQKFNILYFFIFYLDDFINLYKLYILTWFDKIHTHTDTHRLLKIFLITAAKLHLLFFIKIFCQLFCRDFFHHLFTCLIFSFHYYRIPGIYEHP